MSKAVRLSFARRPSAVPYMLRGMLPVRRDADLHSCIVASWRGHRADAAELRAFLEITGLPQGPVLPILYPHVFGFRLVMAVLTHTAFPVPIWGVLQTRNRLEQHRAIPTTAGMDFEVRVRDGRPVAKGAEFDLHTTVTVGGELAWESLLTFFARGRFGEPQPAAESAPVPEEHGSPIARWTPADDHHRAFGRFTGDYNGIHFWDAYARRFGFARALYHPPRVLGECLARLPRVVDGERQRLDVWLKGPVPHRTPVTLLAAPAGDPGAFALFVEAGRPCIVGRLQAAA